MRSYLRYLITSAIVAVAPCGLGCGGPPSHSNIEIKDHGYVKCLPPGWSFVSWESHLGLLLRRATPQIPYVYYAGDTAIGSATLFVEFGADESLCPTANPGPGHYIYVPTTTPTPPTAVPSNP